MVSGEASGGGAEFLGEELEGASDVWAVRAVQGDGDLPGAVDDLPTLVEQVTHDAAVLVGVGEVGVEVLGQPAG